VILVDASVWLSIVLILALSIYSIRSVIFIYRVTRTRANNNLHVIPKAAANNRSTAGKMAVLHFRNRALFLIAAEILELLIGPRVSGWMVNIHSSQYL
jgi:hypothetical protein